MKRKFGWDSKDGLYPFKYIVMRTVPAKTMEAINSKLILIGIMSAMSTLYFPFGIALEDIAKKKLREAQMPMESVSIKNSSKTEKETHCGNQYM